MNIHILIQRSWLRSWSWAEVLARFVLVIVDDAASASVDDLMSIISSAPKLPFKINMMLPNTYMDTHIQHPHSHTLTLTHTHRTANGDYSDYSGIDKPLHIQIKILMRIQKQTQMRLLYTGKKKG